MTREGIPFQASVPNPPKYKENISCVPLRSANHFTKRLINISMQHTKTIQFNTDLATFNIIFGRYRDADKSGTYPIYLFALARQIVITMMMDL